VQKGTDLHASVLLSLAANTPLLSGTSHVVFLLRSENTGHKTAACAACFAGVIFFGVLRLDPNL
jgi:hypothetical protein